MRLGIFSDIHANLPALEAVLVKPVLILTLLTAAATSAVIRLSE